MAALSTKLYNSESTMSNERPTRDRTKWRQKMDQMQRIGDVTDAWLDKTKSNKPEPINTIKTNIKKRFGWDKFISFKDDIQPWQLENADFESVPLAMTPIEEGEGEDIWGKGQDCPFYTRVVWVGFKGFYYENAMIFLQNYDETYDVENHLRKDLKEDDLQLLDQLLETATHPVDWKEVECEVPISP